MKSSSSFLSAGLLALLLLALRFPVGAQAPAWQSAQAIASSMPRNYSVVLATAVDAAGNVYLAGAFLGTVTFGSITLTNIGGSDAFIAKFNPVSNQYVWVQQAGGTGSDEVRALVVRGNSIYVAGTFDSPAASFGSTTLNNVGAINFDDVFVAKLTDAGSTSSFEWAQRAGGTGNDYAAALAVSGSNVYMAGYFDSPTATFGPAVLTGAGSKDVFITKLSDAGSTSSFVWTQRAGGANVDQANALAVSGATIYVAGSFQGSTADFGPTTLTSAGASDAFVAKLTDAGSTSSFGWVQRAGGIGNEGANALVMSGTSVYITGGFGSSTAVFGPVTLNSLGSSSVFVAKLTDAGSTADFVWAQRAGGTGYDMGYVLAVSGTSVYVAGSITGSTAAFGSTTLTNVYATNSDLFVAKLIDSGSTGSFAWAQRAGDSGSDYANALVISNTNLYVSGYSLGSPHFGNFTLTNANPNFPLGFLATLTDPTLTATTAGRALASAQLYPNPARQAATLRLPAGTTPASLTLTDALGRTVRDFPAPPTSEANLDLRGLPSGLYMLRGAGPVQRLAVE